MLRFDLPGAVTDELGTRFAQLSPLTDDVGVLLAHLLQCSASLPTDLLGRALAFRASPTAAGALLITGLPIDRDLPPTPSDGAQPPYKPGAISECAILSVAILLGEPVAYCAEKNGRLVQDVFPTRSDQTAPSNESSAVSLGFHTELTFSRHAPQRPYHVSSPDFVLLLALRCPADRRAATQVIDATDLRGRIDEHHLRILSQAQFQLQAPWSFTRDADGSRPWSPPVALLHGSSMAPWFAFDTACGVRGLSTEAEAALDVLRAACAEPSIQTSVTLGPGDLLVINNKRCAHARSQFTARFDGDDRWLERAYVRRSVWELDGVAGATTPYWLLD